MSSDPHPRFEDSGVGDLADERVIEAMLVSMAPSEVESQENRIVRALDAIATEPVAEDSPAHRIDGTGVAVTGSPKAWQAIGGLGAGLAAMVAVTLILLGRPGEAQASASTWFARAEAAASEAATAIRGYLIDITPHDSASDPRGLRGRLALQEVEGSGPLIRLDIDEPEDRRHSIGVDEEGGWHRRTDDSLREFPGHMINDRLVIPGLDLLLDPLPGFYDRVQRHYEVVEIVEAPRPRLVARHRDQKERNPRVPDRIEIELDPEDWSLRTLVLGWDEPMRGFRQPPRRPGPGMAGERGRHGPPKGPPPGAGSRPAPPPNGPHARGRPGPSSGRGAPPPPAEIRITRVDGETPPQVSRRSS